MTETPNIPVRRNVGGRWETVMVTRSEWAREEGAPCRRENHLVIDGVRYPVINAWTEVESGDGRRRWGVVTEGEGRPVDGIIKPTTVAEALSEPPTRYLMEGGRRYRQEGPRWVLDDVEEQPEAGHATTMPTVDGFDVANCRRLSHDHDPHRWTVGDTAYHCFGEATPTGGQA